MESRKEFIAQLEISPPPTPFPLQQFSSLTASAGTSGGAVDGGSLVSFTSEIDEQNRSDVENSVLLAQLAADSQYQRNENSDLWYKVFVNVLSKVGWIIQEFEFEKYEAHGQSVVVTAVVLDIVKGILSDSEVARSWKH